MAAASSPSELWRTIKPFLVSYKGYSQQEGEEIKEDDQSRMILLVERFDSEGKDTVAFTRRFELTTDEHGVHRFKVCPEFDEFCKQHKEQFFTVHTGVYMLDYNGLCVGAQLSRSPADADAYLTLLTMDRGSLQHLEDAVSSICDKFTVHTGQRPECWMIGGEGREDKEESGDKEDSGDKEESGDGNA
jgi:hypothetical protein